MTDLETFVEGIVDGLLHPKPAAPPPGTPAPSVPIILPPAPVVLPVLTGSSKWNVNNMTAEILRNEGGYVNDPADSGGATNFGITIGFMNLHKDFFGLTAPATSHDVRLLTQTQAAQSYIKFFYLAAHFDLVPNEANIVMQLYDMAVNMGVRYTDGESPATKVLQHALNIPADGVLGPQTAAAVSLAVANRGAASVNNAVVISRIRFYNEVVIAHPQDAKFLPGWTTRANKYKV